MILKKIKIIFRIFYKKIIVCFFIIIYGKINFYRNIKKNFELKKKNIENIEYNIYSISNPRIFSDHTNNVAYIQNNKLINGPSLQFIDKKNSNIKNNIVLKNSTPKFKKKFKGSVASLLIGGSGNNYWHWLIDVIPKFKILDTYIEKIDFFLVPSIKYNFQNETLKYLKIPKKKIISSENFSHIESDKVITCDHPYNLTNNPNIDHLNIPKWISKFLKKKFISLIKKKNFFSKRFYIDRSDSNSIVNKVRYIINEREVQSILVKYGYKIIRLSDLEFLEQVSLFYYAKSIIGLHGAGFANLVFCRPKTNVLELQPSTAGDLFKNFALGNRLKYKKLSFNATYFKRNDQSGAINVDISLLKNYIKNL